MVPWTLEGRDDQDDAGEAVENGVAPHQNTTMKTVKRSAANSSLASACICGL